MLRFKPTFSLSSFAFIKRLFSSSSLSAIRVVSSAFRYDLNKIPYGYTVEVRNRFNRPDLIDRVPDELWMEVCDIIQETGIKTIPMEKKCKKAKWLSEEALQVAVKRREAKSKGDKERYKYLNGHFQRIARDKKVFLSDQCKEIEETIEWIKKLWYIYTMEYYLAIKKNTFESVLMRWIKLEPIIQSEVSQKEKHQYSILTHIYGI